MAGHRQEVGKSRRIGPYWVPFGPASAEVAIRAARKVYDKFPALTDPLEKKYNQWLLGSGGFDNHHLGSSFAWDKLSELKGKKIGAAGPNLPRTAGACDPHHRFNE